MTRIPITPATRTLIKRLFRAPNPFDASGTAGTPGFLFINPNGDITDLTTVLSHRDEAPGKVWHAVSRKHIPDLIAADELTVTEDRARALVNGASVDILSDQHGNSIEHTRVTLDPDAPSVTINSSDGHNRAAMKTLKAAASDVGSLDAHEWGIDGLRIHGNLPGSDNPAFPDGDAPEVAVAGVTTDRYQATLATFTAAPAPIEAVVPGHVLTTAASRADWTLTITEAASAATLPKVGVTVTAPRGTGPDYPHVLPLLTTEDDEHSASITATPKALLAALDTLPGRTAPVALTSDGTVFSDDSPTELPIEGARSEQGRASDRLAVNPRYLRSHLRALGARWPEVTMRWMRPGKRMSVQYGRGIRGVVMPLSGTMTPERPESTSAA